MDGSFIKLDLFDHNSGIRVNKTKYAWFLQESHGDSVGNDLVISLEDTQNISALPPSDFK